MFSVNSACRNILVLLSVLGMVATLLKFKLPKASQGSTLQASLSNDSSIRPAMLVLFGIVINYRTYIAKGLEN